MVAAGSQASEVEATLSATDSISSGDMTAACRVVAASSRVGWASGRGLQLEAREAGLRKGGGKRVKGVEHGCRREKRPGEGGDGEGGESLPTSWLSHRAGTALPKGAYISMAYRCR